MSTKITNSTSMWLKFFRGAGIPAGFDTKYALLFDENRMKMDMLMDIDKECLKDMGIVAMGDIIAILKHARKIHEETKEQAVETNKSSQSPAVNNNNNNDVQKANPPPPLPPSNSNKPASVTVQKTSSTTVNTKAETKSLPVATTSKSLSGNVAKSSIVRSSPQINKSVVRVVSSKPLEEKSKTLLLDSNFAEKKIIVLNKRPNTEIPLKEEVPFQKKIRVLPEHEGKYTIKMPEGTTPRTQKLKNRLGPNVSEMQSSTEKKKSSIFDRLGDSRVSSSTEVKQQTSTTKSRQEVGSDGSDSSSPKVPATSVFERLGNRQTTNDALQSKALSKTKFEVRQNVKEMSPPPTLPPAPKPAYDSKQAYREKTLTTIHSNLYGPSMSLSRPMPARLKSEISSPAPSSSSTSSSSSRLISTKSSKTSSSSSSSSNYSQSQPQQKRSSSYSSSFVQVEEGSKVKRVSVRDYTKEEVIRIARPREESKETFTPDSKIKNLMKSMGWSESNPGLGVRGQGLRAPIEVGTVRSGNFRGGLGFFTARDKNIDFL